MTTRHKTKRLATNTWHLTTGNKQSGLLNRVLNCIVWMERRVWGNSLKPRIPSVKREMYQLVRSRNCLRFDQVDIIGTHGTSATSVTGRHYVRILSDKAHPLCLAFVLMGSTCSKKTMHLHISFSTPYCDYRRIHLCLKFFYILTKI